MAWVRIRRTTCTTGASSATELGSPRGGRTLPRLLDRLEGLDEVIELTDRTVVAVDSAADLRQGSEYRADRLSRLSG